MNVRIPPGPKGHFLLGNTLEFMRRPTLPLMMELARDYGDIAFLRVGGSHIYVLNNPDYIHAALVKHADKLNKTQSAKRAARQYVGDGLIVSDGDFHRRQRRLVQPAFHTNRIETYAQIMVECTHTMLDSWRPGQTPDIAKEMMKLTLEIVARTLFDTGVSGEAYRVGEAIEMILDSIKSRVKSPYPIPDWLPTRQNQRLREAMQTVDTILFRAIQERRASGVDRGDLLSMLLLAMDEDDGTQMPAEQVRAEAVTLIIAGHETSANALTWAWYLLSQNPEIEEKLVDELDTVLAGRAPSVHDLPRLPYIEMVVKEALRLYPPAWIFSRKVIEDITIGDYDIKKGSTLLFCPYMTQHDAHYFDSPEDFVPERFSPEREKEIARFAYYPFGGGLRVCIGQAFALTEMKLILATIAQRYRLSVPLNQEVTLKASTTLRPRGGLPMNLSLRSVHAATPLLPLEEEAER
jgi:cytochrome P450